MCDQKIMIRDGNEVLQFRSSATCTKSSDGFILLSHT